MWSLIELCLNCAQRIGELDLVLIDGVSRRSGGAIVLFCLPIFNCFLCFTHFFIRQILCLGAMTPILESLFQIFLFLTWGLVYCTCYLIRLSFFLSIRFRLFEFLEQWNATFFARGGATCLVAFSTTWRLRSCASMIFNDFSVLYIYFDFIFIIDNFLSLSSLKVFEFIRIV